MHGFRSLRDLIDRYGLAVDLVVTSGHLSCVCDAVVLVILPLIVCFMHESLGLTHIVKLSIDGVRIFTEIAARDHDVEAT